MREVDALNPNRLDGMGIAISGLCLVHCLAVPVGSALLPLVAHSIALPEWMHLALLSAALPVAATALWQGWRRHRQAAAAAVGAAGLVLLGVGLAFHEGLVGAADPELADRIATAMGALLLAGAHWRNWRLMAAR